MNEELLRRIAAEYAQRYGAELQLELEAARSQNEAQQSTPALDRRVRGEINALKRRRYAGIAGLAAACVVLALLLPAAWRFGWQLGMVLGEAPGTAIVSAAPSYEILPLTFDLPDQFSVASVEQDIEKTVYRLESYESGDVVMTMERADDAGAFSGLTPISINGEPAYGSTGHGYCLVAFEKQSILYVLTSAQNIDVLIELSENILV